jgi:hypothetical protein
MPLRYDKETEETERAKNEKPPGQTPSMAQKFRCHSAVDIHDATGGRGQYTRKHKKETNSSR